MDEELRKKLLTIFSNTITIAVVGASSLESKAAHRIPRYLQQQGFTIIPVNLHGGELFGVPVYKSLMDVREDIDVVEVFRPAPETPEIARQAVAVGAWGLWLQLGIESQPARQIAEAAGLTVIMNRCMGADYLHLGLGPSIS